MRSQVAVRLYILNFINPRPYIPHELHLTSQWVGGVGINGRTCAEELTGTLKNVGTGRYWTLGPAPQKAHICPRGPWLRQDTISGNLATGILLEVNAGDLQAIPTRREKFLRSYQWPRRCLQTNPGSPLEIPFRNWTRAAWWKNTKDRQSRSTQWSFESRSIARVPYWPSPVLRQWTLRGVPLLFVAQFPHHERNRSSTWRWIRDH